MASVLPDRTGQAGDKPSSADQAVTRVGGRRLATKSNRESSDVDFALLVCEVVVRQLQVLSLVATRLTRSKWAEKGAEMYHRKRRAHKICMETIGAQVGLEY